MHNMRKSISLTFNQPVAPEFPAQQAKTESDGVPGALPAQRAAIFVQPAAAGPGDGETQPTVVRFGEVWMQPVLQKVHTRPVQQTRLFGGLLSADFGDHKRLHNNVVYLLIDFR